MALKKNSEVAYLGCDFLVVKVDHKKQKVYIKNMAKVLKKEDIEVENKYVRLLHGS